MKKIMFIVTCTIMFLCTFSKHSLAIADKNNTRWQLNTATTGFSQFQVAYVKNKNHVSVGQKGTIRISKDGENWTTVPSGTTNDLYSLAYNSQIFVAVGKGGTIITSQHGSNWTKATTDSTSTFYKIQFIKDRFFVASESGDILTSKNGVTWSKLPLKYSNKPLKAFFVDAIWTGKEYAILLNSEISPITADSPDTITDPSLRIYGTTSYVYLSSDGGKWSGNKFSNQLNAMCSNGKLTVIVGNGTVFTLNNKNVWAKVDITKIINFKYYVPYFTAIVWNGTKFTVIGTHSLGELITMNSADGTHWVHYQKKIYFGDDGMEIRKLYWTGKVYIIMLLISSPPGYTRFQMDYSTDGINLKEVSFDNSSDVINPYNMCFNGKNFVVVGTHGFVGISTDGVHWQDTNKKNQEAIQMDNIESVYKLFWDEKSKQFYAVTCFSTTYLSSDGIKWRMIGKAQDTPIKNLLQDGSDPNIPNEYLDKIKSNSKYVAITHDSIVTSEEGENWTVRYKCSKDGSLRCLKMINNQYIAVGYSGLILTSYDGITWQKEISPIDDYFVDVAYGNGRYIIISCNGNAIYK